MASYRVLDIETVPDSVLWTPGPPKYDLVPGDDNTFHLKAKDEFPPPIACKIVAMAWVDLSGDDNEWYFLKRISSYCRFKPGVEVKMLGHFIKTQEQDLANLVTWNGRGFDMPVINMRALHLKLPMRFYYNDREVRYRYSELGHIDLMDVFADYGGARMQKLGDLARAIGLPGKEGDVKGGSVNELYLSSAFSSEDEQQEVQLRVADYCLSDALQTAMLFLRSRYHRGMIDGAHHDKAVASFIRHASDPTTELGKWHQRQLARKSGVIDWENVKIGAQSSSP